MDRYDAPVDDLLAALRTAGLDDVLATPRHAATDLHDVHDVLTGFGKLAADVIGPTDRVGDREGARFDPTTGEVHLPDEITRAYQRFVEGGWPGIAADVELGGGGMPGAVGTAVHEVFGSANLALSLQPMLTRGAVELLERWGDERHRSVVLPRLVDGTWSGTMNLTEPDAGSDLGAVRTMATPRPDGTWSLNGTKIFITWGEHSLNENIVHLVLARTPGAPEGTRGISLFLVGKYLIGEQGALGTHNGVHCRSIEHKLGIHASPTCVLEFADAVGELVGPLHGGMPAMFSMMNPARLAVGVQGVSVAERAYQQALRYAYERRQGRSEDPSGPCAIVEHPDVQRMLLDMAVLRDGARLLAFATAVAGDLAIAHTDEAERARLQRRADLLTPLAKAWPTDVSERVASTAVQIHGGMGFVEETGVAQRFRDVRIASIYEGTNGIQAIDLVGRKIVRDGGAAVYELLADVSATVDAVAGDPELHEVATQLDGALAAARTAVDWVLDRFETDRTSVLAGATPLAELLALVTVGHLLVRHALSAHLTHPAERSADDSGDPVAGAARRRAVRRVQYFATHHLQRRPSIATIQAGARSLRVGID
ncbi:MAG: acyl-CoA dehydrogenase [Actinobacteria bacterium]|uniref:Unannotated protein n=1 Tax=freshwater metagenome TaxID=449393 RepID=A0A6J6C3M7_9ZZZZ|nr:acyl-CoA dehydrogenase [Actinomycetota bacterium]